MNDTDATHRIIDAVALGHITASAAHAYVRANLSPQQLDTILTAAREERSPTPTFKQQDPYQTYGMPTNYDR